MKGKILKNDYSLKIVSDGRLQATNICLVRNGKQLFELFCYSVKIEINVYNLYYGTAVVLIRPGMDKKQVKMLSEAIRGPIVVGKEKSKIVIYLRISEIAVNWKI